MPSPKRPLVYPELTAALARADRPRRDVASQCGITYAWLAQIQRGHGVPSIELKHRLARVLDRPVAELFPDVVDAEVPA